MKKRRQANYSTVIALTILAGNSLLLTACRQDHDAHKSAQVEMPVVADPSSSIDRLRVGSSITEIRGHAITGRPITVDLTDRAKDTLVLVFSPSCPYCRLNFHNWRELLGSNYDVNVLWVDITGTATERYMSSYGIPINATVVLLDGDASPLGISPTPTTILVDRHGRIKWINGGIIDDVRMKELRHSMQQQVM